MSVIAANLLRGSTLRVLHLCFNVVSSFFLMPFIIHSVGDRMYGIWILVTSFLGFYWLFNVGLGPATQRYVSNALGTEDFGTANRYINSSFRIYGIIGVLVLLVTSVAAFGISYFQIEGSDSHLLSTLILILGGNFAIGMPMRVFSGVLSSHLRFDIVSTIGIVRDFVRVAAIVILLGQGYGILYLAIVHVITDIIEYSLNFMFVLKIAQYFRLDWKFSEKLLAKELFNFSWIALGVQLTERFRYSIDNFIIAGYLGTESITVYTIAWRLVDYYQQTISSALGIMLPVYSRINDDILAAQEQFLFVTKLSVFLSTFVAGSLAIFGKHLIEAWVGARFDESYTLMLVLIVPTLVKLMQQTGGELLFGFRRHMDYLRITAFEFASGLVLTLLFVEKLGLIGIAIGGSLPILVFRCWLLPKYTCRLIKVNRGRYFLFLIRNFSISAAVMIGFYLLVNRSMTTDLYRLALMGICLMLVYGSAILCFGFSRIERNRIRNIVYGCRLR